MPVINAFFILNPVYLVYLVRSVYLVYLVYLVPVKWAPHGVVFTLHRASPISRDKFLWFVESNVLMG